MTLFFMTTTLTHTIYVDVIFKKYKFHIYSKMNVGSLTLFQRAVLFDGLRCYSPGDL